MAHALGRERPLGGTLEAMAWSLVQSQGSDSSGRDTLLIALPPT